MCRQSTWTSRARDLARRGWSVDQIADACGVWPTRVRRALRAQRVDDPVDLSAMAKALGITERELRAAGAQMEATIAA